ncbi:MAG: RNA polymerase sigma factor [Acidimicrobiales bacterium]
MSCVPQMNRLPHPGSDVDALFEHLHSTGPGFVEAVERLHGLMLRAARHQLTRMPAACSRLGAAGIDEIANQAADEATVAALGKMDSFEGRSRFSTWAYKFGVLHALSSANRAAWRDRNLPLDAVSEPPAKTLSPEASLEEAEMSSILSAAISKSLTPHQRDVIIALILNDVPIDALAEQMGLTRNALYKVLYDARKRLRSILQAQGYLTDTTTRGVSA